MKLTTVQFQVQHEETVTPNDVCTYLYSLVNTGLDGAKDILEDPEAQDHHKEAQTILDLVIKPPTHLK